MVAGDKIAVFREAVRGKGGGVKAYGRREEGLAGCTEVVARRP